MSVSTFVLLHNSIIIVCQDTNDSSILIIVDDVGRHLWVDYYESISTEQ